MSGASLAVGPRSGAGRARSGVTAEPKITAERAGPPPRGAHLVLEGAVGDGEQRQVGRLGQVREARVSTGVPPIWPYRGLTR